MCTAVMDISEKKTSGKPSKKGAKKQPAKYKKAPGAPRRFKSAFIFFSTQKHKEIRSQLGEKGSKEKTTNVAKMVSEAWKGLPADEREYWDDMARRDKERYEVEKSLYDGPWKVPAQKASKDPNAPKRPMSAFLSYSNSKRSSVKRQNQGLTNAEVSRVLAAMWKNAQVDEKQVYIDEEFKLRQKYKLDISEWRANEEKEKEVQRKHREDMALRTLENHKRQMDGQDHDGLATSREGLPQLQIPPHMSSYGDSRMEREGRASYPSHHREESLEQNPMSSMDLLSNQQMQSSLNSPFGGYSGSFNDQSTMSSLLGQSAFSTAQTLFDQQALMSNLQQHQQQQWAVRDSALTPRGMGASSMGSSALGSRNDALLDALRHNMSSNRYASGRYPPNRDYGGDEHQQGGRGGNDFNHFFDPSQGY